MFDLKAVQSALKEYGIDAWLLYDFRSSNVLARRILDLGEDTIATRRFFYLVPAKGEPKKLVHQIEPGILDHLPGEKLRYLRWQKLEEAVAKLVAGFSSVAMEYSPRNANPYVSRVDAGTVELVRRQAVEVVSSGDLVQLFEATWDEEQWRMHVEAARITATAFELAFGFIAERIDKGFKPRETDVQQLILDHFNMREAVTDHSPIVAVGPNSGDPHYAPSKGGDAEIKSGDFVLIDLWCKLRQPRAVYSDLTRVGFVGSEVPSQYSEVFQIVAEARDAAIERVRTAMEGGEPLLGWQVDEAARSVIERAGYSESFVHRTGHSIGQETHGNGANMDDLETHEERRVMRRTCFSIEPGIYLPEFGIRSEVNVFIDAEGAVHVTGGEPQRDVLPLLAR